MMKKTILIVILILLFSLFLGADVYIKKMERVKAFELMGKKQKESVEIKELWLAENKFVQFGKDLSIIVDYNKEKLYLIAHQPKVYYEIPADITREKLLALISKLSPKAAEVVESIKITNAKVNLSGETKKIANWNCNSTEFEMVLMIPALNMMPKFKMKTWTTKDFPPDYNKYTKLVEEFFVKYYLGMINIEEASKKELEKLETVDGFEVAVDITISVFGTEINVESQCLEVTEKTAPPGVYSVPKGYQKKTINFP